jgi:hypothetical protein
MTMTVKQQVFGLKIPVDDAMFVKILERKCYLGGVEFGNRVGKPLKKVLV